MSLVRLQRSEFNAKEAASRISPDDPYVRDAIETIVERARLVGDGNAVADACLAHLRAKLDLWVAEAQNRTGGRTLTYSESWGSDGPRRGTTVSLLQRPGLGRWEEFTCLNSLREVEPTVKLIVDDGGLDDTGQRPQEEQQAEPPQAAEGGPA